MSPITITSIGLGNMGSALAAALLTSSSSSASSLTLTLWNRNSSRPGISSLLASPNAKFIPDLTEAIAQSKILLICLLDYPSISAAFSSVSSDTLKGKTVINLTNGTPAQARAMSAFFKENGAKAYFDGAVMVTPQLVGPVTGHILLSGETHDRFLSASLPDLLKLLGKIVYLGEEVGAASLQDVAALSAMYGMFAGVFTAFALLRKGPAGAKNGVKGVTKDLVVPLLHAMVPYVDLLAEAVDEERWEDNLGNPIGMQATGLANILKACEEVGVDGAKGLGGLLEVMQQAIKARGEEGGVAVVVEYL